MEITAETPLLERLSVPPVFVRTSMEALAEKGSIPPQATFPDAAWTRILSDKQGRRLPQAIAHRGYKAKYPENTMGAFTGAVNVGAHAIETDIHLSKDRVVVLSHVSLSITFD